VANIIKFIKKYLQLHNFKRQLSSLPIEIKNGSWHIDDDLFWQSAENKKKVESLFFLFYQSHKLTDKSWRTQVAKLIFKVLAISLFRVSFGSAKGPSVIFKSRGGALKLFDFDNYEVITLISGKTADNLNYARALPIFEYFPTNTFTIDQSLRLKRNLCIKREPLVDVPCMGMNSIPDQIQIMKKICSTYIEYAKHHAMAPTPNLFEGCLDEVADYLTYDARAQCLMMKDRYLEFIQTAHTLPAHLDLNVANIINNNGDLLVLDIEDAGLHLPITYDMNYLLLIEVYQDRSMHLLEEVLRDECGTGYSDLMQLTTRGKTSSQLGVSFFVNFILHESRYVSVKLLKNWETGQAQRNWEKLARCLPGWPFVYNRL